jgi:MFS family permease
MAQFRSLRSMGALVWQNIVDTTAGGRWSRQLAETTRRNLRWFFSDGSFSSASDSITATYLMLYLLALGATGADIGWMTSLISVAAVMVLLPGAMLAERAKSRKKVVLYSGGFVSRLILLLMALVPFVFGGQAAVIVLIILKICGDSFANLGFPAWASLAADFVPLAWRGRYFASRNISMGVIGMVMTYVMGQLITSVGAPIGYQIAFGCAFLFGSISTFSYAHLQEPAAIPQTVVPQTYTPAAILSTLRSDRNFLAYCVYIMIWNFGLNLAGPFFTVYQVQVLKASAVLVGFISIVSTLSSLPAQRYFGRLADRWGARRVIILNGFLIPFIPILWAFTTASWQPILINIYSGVLWAGYNLAAFNYLLTLTKAENRARYTAMAQVAVALSTALGAGLGGEIVTHWGYVAVFIGSGVFRAIGSLVFARFVKDPH